MARIIAGTHKGRRLAPVPTDDTRPTSDRVKESLFSRLEGYNAIEEAVVVDLFAGSGALGLEALSRGAAAVELVDRAEQAYKTLKKNAALFSAENGKPGSVSIHKSEALKYLTRREGPQIELLFIDPPYSMDEEQLTAILAASAPQLHEAATVVVERGKRNKEPQWPEGIEAFSERSYGTTRLWFAEPVAETGD